MNDPRLPKLVFVLMLALGLLHWIHVYPQLPGVMAAHFGADGTPNGYQPKQAFFAFMFVVLGLSAFVAFVTPRVLANKPPERMNLPNKAYWLSAAHRDETVRFFRAQMGWSAAPFSSCCSTVPLSRSGPTFLHLTNSIPSA